MQPAIEVDRVSKCYRMYHKDRPWTIQELLQRGGGPFSATQRFWALRDVTFRVKSGAMVGVVGLNGAGKSTLLRLIGGIGRADSGRVVVSGRVGGLLDLCAGFHPDLTGRENVIINGIIGGLTRREAIARFPAIVEFSELEDFIDHPLRTYSLGMQMRLGFSVAAHLDSDVLLIDEVLAVGDVAFQRKCLDRIRGFKSSGCTTLIASHASEQIESLCDEVLWLRQGEPLTQGPTRIVMGQYLEHARGGETARAAGLSGS